MKASKKKWFVIVGLWGVLAGLLAWQSRPVTRVPHPASVMCAYLGEVVFRGDVEDYWFEGDHLIITKNGVGVLSLTNIPCFVQEYNQAK